jgi:hypothetical protein
MYEHDVATRCTGKGQPETAIMLRPKGVQAYKNGGWKKYLVEYEKQQLEKAELARQPHIKVSGNAIIGDNNSNNSLNQSDFSDLPQAQPIAAPKRKAPQTSDDTKINISTAQFIFWLISVFLTGLGIGIAVLSYLKK